MAVQARMYVQSKKEHASGGVEVQLQVVSRGVANKEWAQYTPGGNLTLMVKNQVASDEFLLGKEYLVTFELARPDLQ